MRAIFFDFGGTLVVSDPDPFPAFRSIVGRTGIDVSRERYAEAERVVSAHLEPLRYGLLGRKPSFLDQINIELLLELGIGDSDGALVASLHEAYTSPDWRKPFPESVEVLETLQSSGIPVHLVSNSSDMLLEVIARRDWQRFFHSVTFSQEVGAEKPDRRVFEFALHRAGCDSAEVTHVGDTWEVDYLGAKRAGLRPIWLNRAGVSPPAPCEMIRDLAEVPRLLGI